MALEEGTHPGSLSDASMPGHPLHHPHHYQHHLRHPWAASFHTLPIFVTTWNMYVASPDTGVQQPDTGLQQPDTGLQRGEPLTPVCVHVCVCRLGRGACEASSLSDVSSWIPGRSAGYHTIVVGTQVGAARLHGVAGSRDQSPLQVMTQPCLQALCATMCVAGVSVSA